MAQSPADPAEALAQMIPMALSRQGSIGTLLLSLAAIAVRGTILPEPVARGAAQVLAGRVMAEGGRLTGPALKAAVEQSGVLLEAGLAKSAPLGPDTKSALLELKSALSTWLGGDPGAVAPARKAPPPVKGTVPRVQLPETPVLPDAPRDLGRALHGHTEAALSRLKLLQLASLPDSGGVMRPAGPELRLELPLMIGPELAMLQLQISRDGRRRDRAQQRGWTMRFALDSAATGEVGAEIALLGRAISIVLWATDPDTAKALEADLPQLSERVSSIGLDPGAIRLRRGAPETAAPASGHLLERMS
ncbi:MAG: flagellar hook-length control protein FliK [Devosia sp.]